MLAHLLRKRLEQLFLLLPAFVGCVMLQEQTQKHAFFWTFHSQGMQPGRSISSNHITDFILDEEFCSGRYGLSIAFVTGNVGEEVDQKRCLGHGGDQRGEGGSKVLGCRRPLNSSTPFILVRSITQSLIASSFRLLSVLIYTSKCNYYVFARNSCFSFVFKNFN